MQYFNIEDDRADGCDVCCCQQAKGKPGETDRWVLNYAPIVVPANAQRLVEGTRFEVEKVSNCVGDCPPGAVAPEFATTTSGEPYAGDLSDAVDVEGASLVFELAPFSRPKFGKVTLDESGIYTYTPRPGVQGYDRFFWQVSINGGKPIVAEAVIGVGVTAPGVAQLTPDICLTCPQIDNKRFTVSFGLVISPAAVPGDQYRLLVKQQYRDCDCCYTRTDCFDVVIGACR